MGVVIAFPEPDHPPENGEMIHMSDEEMDVELLNASVEFIVMMGLSKQFDEYLIKRGEAFWKRGPSHWGR